MLSFIDFFHFISTCNVKFTSKGWTKEVLIELLVNSGLLKISANIYLFKVNNENTREMYGIYSKSKITPE